jgi:DNA-binding XRE family transcriptional regulator
MRKRRMTAAVYVATTLDGSPSWIGVSQRRTALLRGSTQRQGLRFVRSWKVPTVRLAELIVAAAKSDLGSTGVRSSDGWLLCSGGDAEVAVLRVVHRYEAAGEGGSAAETLRALRDQMGIDRATLAAIAGVSQTRPLRWESGMGEPRLTTLQRIVHRASALNILTFDPLRVIRAPIQEPAND